MIAARKEIEYDKIVSYVDRILASAEPSVVKYSAMVGQDPASNKAIYNDWIDASRSFGLGGAQLLTNREVIVDLDELKRWLCDSEAAA